MRNNSNSRHMRPRNNNGRSNNSGRSNNNGGSSNSSSNNSNNNSSGNNNNYKQRMNPKVQTFDSNGPDVRVRGTAYQISDKYLSLAKDASSVGDIILAESYFQHAEHYQRFINEMTERYEQNNQNRQQQLPKDENSQEAGNNGGESYEGNETETHENEMEDLDQSFLRGAPRVEDLGAVPVPEVVVIENNVEIVMPKPEIVKPEPEVAAETISEDTAPKKRKIVLPRKPRAVEAEA